MPFFTEANTVLPTLPQGSANRAILEYLLNNALGKDNAKSWDMIEAHCAAIPVDVDKLDFQQGFLAQTRDEQIFIGSSSHGYFIIQNRDDAVKAASFYQSRIARQQEHLDHLTDLMAMEGWAPPI